MDLPACSHQGAGKHSPELWFPVPGVRMWREKAAWAGLTVLAQQLTQWKNKSRLLPDQRLNQLPWERRVSTRGQRGVARWGGGGGRLWPHLAEPLAARLAPCLSKPSLQTRATEPSLEVSSWWCNYIVTAWNQQVICITCNNCMCKIRELNIMSHFMITNFGFVVLKVSLALESVSTSKE